MIAKANITLEHLVSFLSHANVERCDSSNSMHGQCELTNSYEAQPTPLRRHQSSWEPSSISTDAETVRYRFTDFHAPLSIL